jgi:hypothetical protein
MVRGAQMYIQVSQLTVHQVLLYYLGKKSARMLIVILHGVQTFYSLVIYNYPRLQELAKAAGAEWIAVTCA